MRIRLIINGRDPERGERLQELADGLLGEGHDVVSQATHGAGDACRLAGAAVADAVDLVVCAGGDGTIHEVVNGMQAQALRSVGAPIPRLALIPWGTANDLAGALQIPADPEAALEVALRGEVRQCDVGQVEDRFFLNVSTGGFGAEATEETSQELKRVLGPLAYLITGVEKFIALDPSSARFTADEVLYDGPFLLFAVGNSRQSGGGNLLTPHADLSDGLLDVCVVAEMSRLDFVRLLPDLRAGRHVDHPAVVYRQVRELRVESQELLSVNADGEPLSGRSFHYRLAPARISLMVPRPASPAGAES